jgi:hypothetical protein
MKSQQRLAPQGCGFSFRRALLIAEPERRQNTLLFRINQETGQAIDLFRRTSLAGIGISIDDLTFT